MKKILLTSFIFTLSFMLVGCGSKSKEEAFKEHNKNNNAVECTAKDEKNEATIYIYFDELDIVSSFDYFMKLNAEDVSRDDVKKARELICNGQGEFKKEWIEECSYELSGDYINAHVYINNGEWFDGNQTKKNILKKDNPYFSSYTCTEKNSEQ